MALLNLKSKPLQIQDSAQVHPVTEDGLSIKMARLMWLKKG